MRCRHASAPFLHALGVGALELGRAEELPAPPGRVAVAPRVPAGLEHVLPVEELERLDDLEARHDGVGGCDGGDDVARDGLDVEAGLGRDPKGVGAEVGRRRHEVEVRGAVLAKVQRAEGGDVGRVGEEAREGGEEEGGGLLEGGDALVGEDGGGGGGRRRRRRRRRGRGGGSGGRGGGRDPLDHLQLQGRRRVGRGLVGVGRHLEPPRDFVVEDGAEDGAGVGGGRGRVQAPLRPARDEVHVDALHAGARLAGGSIRGGLGGGLGRGCCSRCSRCCCRCCCSPCVVGLLLVEVGGGGVAEEELVELLGPHHAVDRLVRRGPDRADGVLGLRGLGLALEALGAPLFDDKGLPQVPLRARLHQRLVRGQAQPVHVPPGGDVVEGVDDDVEPVEEADAEARLLDVGVVGDDGRGGRGGRPRERRLPRHHGLGQPDVVRAEEELPVEVGDVNGVQVDDLQGGERLGARGRARAKNSEAPFWPSSSPHVGPSARPRDTRRETHVDVGEAREHEVLEELAADPAGADDEELGRANAREEGIALRGEWGEGGGESSTQCEGRAHEKYTGVRALHAPAPRRARRRAMKPFRREMCLFSAHLRIPPLAGSPPLPPASSRRAG
jgi:hypothetical protein